MSYEFLRSNQLFLRGNYLCRCFKIFFFQSYPQWNPFPTISERDISNRNEWRSKGGPRRLLKTFKRALSFFVQFPGVPNTTRQHCLDDPFRERNVCVCVNRGEHNRSIFFPKGSKFTFSMEKGCSGFLSFFFLIYISFHIRFAFSPLFRSFEKFYWT